MRAAVVGTRWGAVHVAALRAAGVDVAAVVDRDAERARAAAHELRVPTALVDPAQLAGLGLDLVTVATPAASHADVIASLPADLPVLCEKPAIGLSDGPDVLLRSAPVWVNYAFAFLAVAERAADALAGLGPVRRARVRSTHDLDRVPLADDAMLFELVPHPLSWLVTVLGPPSPRRASPAHSPVAELRCGDVPVELTCAADPGLYGLRHDVVIEAAAARLELTGTYREGGSWVFDAPRLHLTDGEIQVLGDPETGSVDPWYLANERAIGAVVDAIRGAPADDRLFDWGTGVSVDLAIRAGLTGRRQA